MTVWPLPKVIYTPVSPAWDTQAQVLIACWRRARYIHSHGIVPCWDVSIRFDLVINNG